MLLPPKSYGGIRHRLGSTQGFTGVVQGNQVTLLHDGVQTYPAMLEAIENATEEVLLEMYWIDSGSIGRRFAAAMSDKARQGLKVALIYDAIGSFEADDEMFDEMRAAGCTVIEYNPIAPWRRRFRVGVVNNRNHRKLLVVDQSIGFTGGLNISDVWLPVEEGGEGWRDDMVRVVGPAALQMRAIFMHAYNRLVRDLDVRTEVAGGAADTLDVGCGVRVLANHYLGERRAIRSAYLERIAAARESVYITNSYFVPDAVIRRALAQAVERGVDVRVMIPGESDVPAVYYASKRLYPWLLSHGIHVHEWQGEMLHAKTAVIDRSWCTVGTYNLDYRSWRFNLEVTAAIEDDAVGSAMARRFLLDLAQAPEIVEEDNRWRPLFERFLENFFYLFRKML